MHASDTVSSLHFTSVTSLHFIASIYASGTVSPPYHPCRPLLTTPNMSQVSLLPEGGMRLSCFLEPADEKRFMLGWNGAPRAAKTAARDP